MIGQAVRDGQEAAELLGSPGGTEAGGRCPDRVRLRSPGRRSPSEALEEGQLDEVEPAQHPGPLEEVEGARRSRERPAEIGHGRPAGLGAQPPSRVEPGSSGTGLKRLVMGILRSLPKARLVTRGPGAACLRLYSARSTSSTTRCTA